MSGWIPRLALCAGFFATGLIAGRLLVPEQPGQTSDPTASESVSEATGPPAHAGPGDEAPIPDFAAVLDRLDGRIADLNPEPTTNEEKIERLISTALADQPEPVRAEWLEKLRDMSIEDAEFLLEQRCAAFGDSSSLIMQTSFESVPEKAASLNNTESE